MSRTRSAMRAVDGRDHARGSATPALTIVEYGDYDCPHTRKAQAFVDRLMRENPDLRVVFRHFPLRQLHVNAELLSRVAESVARQGMFWEMHDHLMHHRTAVDEEALLADAAEGGVDMQRARAQMLEGALMPRLEDDVESGAL